MTGGWLDEILLHQRHGKSQALAEIGRQFMLGLVDMPRPADPGPAVRWVAETADPLADELALLEQLRRAYDVPTVWVPIENSRGQRTGESVEMPADGLGAWLRQRRRDRLRPGLVAEIERRCWEATRR